MRWNLEKILRKFKLTFGKLVTILSKHGKYFEEIVPGGDIRFKIKILIF